MGKQGSRSIVTKAEDLYKRFPEKFSQDFDANKRSLDGQDIPDENPAQHRSRPHHKAREDEERGLAAELSATMRVGSSSSLFLSSL